MLSVQPLLATTPRPTSLPQGITASNGALLLGNALSYAAGSNTGSTPIALLGAEARQPGYITDVENTLASYGGFSVTSVDVENSTPTLATLENYRAVLVWSDTYFSNPSSLGDVLADYVDAGGGVVLAWAADSLGGNIAPTGRWTSGGYSPYAYDNSPTAGNATIGQVLVPSSPLLSGVSDFNIGSGGFAAEVSLAAGATDIADLTSGYSLVAEKTGFAGKSVALNFYPPSGNVNSRSWPVDVGTGVPLTDSAVLSGGSNPTGTITFTLVAPGGSTVDTESVTVSGNGTYTTPVGYTIPYHGGLAGIYQWNASYSGDAINDPVSDNNDPAEQVQVGISTPVVPTFTATPRPTSLTVGRMAINGALLLGNALSYAAGSNTGSTPIALLGAEAANPGYITDVENTLASYGGFSVTSVDVENSTPTLATLENYRAVLVWSDTSFSNPSSLGDVLADYVDAGGGVVLAWAADSYDGNVCAKRKVDFGRI